MSEWWSYSPSDFLLFSPRAYYRLFELHNAAVWPAQLLAFAAGVGVLAALRRQTPRASRGVTLALAILWLWVAYAFLWRRYLTINWAAIYAVVAFALEGVMLGVLAAVGRGLHFRLARDRRSAVGVALFVFAVTLYPALAPAFGRALAQGEVFGLAPDPTAIATLGLLVIADGRRRWLPFVVPVTWCLLSGLTLWTMGSPDAWVPPVAALLAVAAGVRQRTPALEARPL